MSKLPGRRFASGMFSRRLRVVLREVDLRSFRLGSRYAGRIDSLVSSHLPDIALIILFGAGLALGLGLYLGRMSILFVAFCGGLVAFAFQATYIVTEIISAHRAKTFGASSVVHRGVG